MRNTARRKLNFSATRFRIERASQASRYLSRFRAQQTKKRACFQARFSLRVNSAFPAGESHQHDVPGDHRRDTGKRGHQHFRRHAISVGVVIQRSTGAVEDHAIACVLCIRAEHETTTVQRTGLADANEPLVDLDFVGAADEIRDRVRRAEAGVEQEHVGAVTANQDITAGAARQRVGISTAAQGVRTVVAAQHVSAHTTVEHVVAVTAAEGIDTGVAVEFVVGDATEQRIVAVSAAQYVRVAATIEGVVAQTAEEDVVVGAAVEVVVVSTAGEFIVAGVADQRVVAGFTEQIIVFGTAVEYVAAVTAVQGVVTGTTELRVGAVVAVEYIALRATGRVLPRFHGHFH